MAETSTTLKALRDKVYTFIEGKMNAADIATFTIGAQSVTKYSLAELTALYEYLCSRIEAIDGGTEYWDNFDDGVEWTGNDGTVEVGDDE